jgi:hypothetical protein
MARRETVAFGKGLRGDGTLPLVKRHVDNGCDRQETFAG